MHTGTGSTIIGTLLNGGGLDERYGRSVGGAGTALLTDALGSLLHIVNAAGATTATYTYEPYGAVTHSGTDSTGFQYTGREVDVGGLMYYRARYYNPRTARFISEDPIGLAGGVNLYGYVGGNPVSYVDPTGLAPPGRGARLPYPQAPVPYPWKKPKPIEDDSEVLGGRDRPDARPDRNEGRKKKCERDCDWQYDRDRQFCSTQGAMTGESYAFVACMRDFARPRYYRCLEECENSCR